MNSRDLVVHIPLYPDFGPEPHIPKPLPRLFCSVCGMLRAAKTLGIYRVDLVWNHPAELICRYCQQRNRGGLEVQRWRDVPASR